MRITNEVYNLIIKRRTVRLFKQKEIPLNIVRKVLNAARVAPSAGNLQFLEYLVVRNKKLREKVFVHTRWAGYVRPRRTPSAHRRPTLYIVILANKEKSQNPDLRDVGAAAENMLLSLVSFGLEGCWIASLDNKKLRKVLKIPSKYNIDSLIAAGQAAESPKLETGIGEVKYWIDERNRLHVPKRPLESIVYYDKIK
ncbi:MAG: nitroreductase family protein [Candidatus Omnitrophota bacterium]|nr:MAG: nitroreductase family protein [Candidatus Omnitrophota bacterium]